MPVVEAHNVRAAHDAGGGEVLRPKGVAREGGYRRLQRDHGRVQRGLALLPLHRVEVKDKPTQGTRATTHIIGYVVGRGHVGLQGSYGGRYDDP